ncbi:hypothetical protein [Bacillus sp. Marseille-Q1617]|nr:hypothetical protein [Bacillus sp. Marseille-Q1617]
MISRLDKIGTVKATRVSSFVLPECFLLLYQRKYIKGKKPDFGLK